MSNEALTNIVDNLGAFRAQLIALPARSLGVLEDNAIIGNGDAAISSVKSLEPLLQGLRIVNLASYSLDHIAAFTSFADLFDTLKQNPFSNGFQVSELVEFVDSIVTEGFCLFQNAASRRFVQHVLTTEASLALDIDALVLILPPWLLDTVNVDDIAQFPMVVQLVSVVDHVASTIQVVQTQVLSALNPSTSRSISPIPAAIAEVASGISGSELALFGSLASLLDTIQDILQAINWADIMAAGAAFKETLASNATDFPCTNETFPDGSIPQLETEHMDALNLLGSLWGPLLQLFDQAQSFSSTDAASQLGVAADLSSLLAVIDGARVGSPVFRFIMRTKSIVEEGISYLDIVPIIEDFISSVGDLSAKAIADLPPLVEALQGAVAKILNTRLSSGAAFARILLQRGVDDMYLFLQGSSGAEVTALISAIEDVRFMLQLSPGGHTRPWQVQWAVASLTELIATAEAAVSALGASNNPSTGLTDIRVNGNTMRELMRNKQILNSISAARWYIEMATEATPLVDAVASFIGAIDNIGNALDILGSEVSPAFFEFVTVLLDDYLQSLVRRGASNLENKIAGILETVSQVLEIGNLVFQLEPVVDKLLQGDLLGALDQTQDILTAVVGQCAEGKAVRLVQLLNLPISDSLTNGMNESLANVQNLFKDLELPTAKGQGIFTGDFADLDPSEIVDQFDALNWFTVYATKASDSIGFISSSILNAKRTITDAVLKARATVTVGVSSSSARRRRLVISDTISDLINSNDATLRWLGGLAEGDADYAVVIQEAIHTGDLKDLLRSDTVSALTSFLVNGHEGFVGQLDEMYSGITDAMGQLQQFESADHFIGELASQDLVPLASAFAKQFGGEKAQDIATTIVETIVGFRDIFFRVKETIDTLVALTSMTPKEIFTVGLPAVFDAVGEFIETLKTGPILPLLGDSVEGQLAQPMDWWQGGNLFAVLDATMTNVKDVLNTVKGAHPEVNDLIDVVTNLSGALTVTGGVGTLSRVTAVKEVIATFDVTWTTLEAQYSTTVDAIASADTTGAMTALRNFIRRIRKWTENNAVAFAIGIVNTVIEYGRSAVELGEVLFDLAGMSFSEIIATAKDRAWGLLEGFFDAVSPTLLKELTSVLPSSVDVQRLASLVNSIANADLFQVISDALPQQSRRLALDQTKLQQIAVQLQAQFDLVSMAFNSLTVSFPPTVDSLISGTPQYLNLFMSFAEINDAVSNLDELFIEFNVDVRVSDIDGLANIVSMLSAIPRSGKRQDWVMVNLVAGATQLVPVVQDVVDVIQVVRGGGSVTDIARVAGPALKRGLTLLLTTSDKFAKGLAGALTKFNNVVLPAIPTGNGVLAKLDELIAYEQKVDDIKAKVVNVIISVGDKVEGAIDKVRGVFVAIEVHIAPRLAVLDDILDIVNSFVGRIANFLAGSNVAVRAAEILEEQALKVLLRVRTEVVSRIDQFVQLVENVVKRGLDKFRALVLSVLNKLEVEVKKALDRLEGWLEKTIGPKSPQISALANALLSKIDIVRAIVKTITNAGSFAAKAGEAAESFGEIGEKLQYIGNMVSTIGGKVSDIIDKAESFLEIVADMESVSDLVDPLRSLADKVRKVLEAGVEAAIKKLQDLAFDVIDQGRSYVVGLVDKLDSAIQNGIRVVSREIGERFAPNRAPGSHRSRCC